jgi:fucose permease
MKRALREPGPSRWSGRGFDLLSLGTFVVLGVPDGMLGTAWPSARESFRAPIGDLGLILLVATVGSVGVAGFVGSLIRRRGITELLVLGAAIAACGAVGFAVAPGLWYLCGGALLLGAAAGLMDGGLNTAIGLQGRRRLLNLLHGSYGLGTALGPLLVTAAVLIASWRLAYAALVLLDATLALSWVWHRRHAPERSRMATKPPPSEPAAPHASEQWSRRRSGGVIVVGMVVFFIYTGLEVSAGQWEASFCRSHLGLSPGSAGIATFGYWGALTAVRVGLAVVRRPIRLTRIIGWGSVLSVVGASAVWWEPDVAVALAGFVILGAALAGIFPALIALTPRRLGERRSEHVIAWQVGAAVAGGSGIAALIGLWIDATSLAVLGPAITALSVLLILGNLVLGRVAPLPRGAGAAT